MKKVIGFLLIMCGLFVVVSCGKGHQHNLSDWVNDETNHWKTCSGCEELLDKAAHTYGEWTEITAPTETAVGKKTRTCSVCNYVENAEIPKLNHTHKKSDWVNDETNHWKTCSGCNELLDKAAHTYDDGVESTIVTTENGTRIYTCSVCKKIKQENVLAYNLVGTLVSKTWTNYEAFSLYVRRTTAGVAVRLVSANDVFVSEGRNSKLELYFVTGDNVAVRDGNAGVTRIIVKSDESYEVYNYGDVDLSNKSINVKVRKYAKTVIDVELSYDALGMNKDDIFGLTCGLWSEVDTDWAPMNALDTNSLAAVEDPRQYVRCDKENKCFISDKNAYPETPKYDKTELTKGYEYGVADPTKVGDPNADDIYLKVTKTNTQFVFDMIGFGTFTDSEHVKLVIHTSETNGIGWAIQASDITFLISKSKATKLTNKTAFWDYVNFGDNDTLANNTPTYKENETGYFTLSFAVDFTEIPEYSVKNKVSFLMLEFNEGNIYNADPWNSAMTKNGVGIGDPAAQASYQVIQEKELSVDKDSLLESYKYKFSTDYYANIEKTDNGIKLNFISFVKLEDNHFIRFVVNTDDSKATGGWALEANDVGFVIFKNSVYVSTNKTGFWDDEANQFHDTTTTLNNPIYEDKGEYWTLSIEIDYTELGVSIDKTSTLSGLLVAFVPTIKNEGFDFNGTVPGDIALQQNYFVF